MEYANAWMDIIQSMETAQPVESAQLDVQDAQVNQFVLNVNLHLRLWVLLALAEVHPSLQVEPQLLQLLQSALAISQTVASVQSQLSIA